MVTRVRPGRDGTWQVAVGQGPSAFQREAFADRAAAEDWAAMATLAARVCMVRIGTKRFLGTAAEALRRWAIDQGTLPRSEGGTEIAPLQRLAPLMADPDCALPLAALQPVDLAALRARRQAALGCTAEMLVEQAALAAALEHFRDFHIPALDDPFAEPAPDGLCLLDEATCAQAIGWASAESATMGRLVALMLSTAAAPETLLACCNGQAEARSGQLRLPGGQVVAVPSGLLPGQDVPFAAPLLPGLTAAAAAAGLARLAQRLGRPGMAAPALQLTALAQALAQGQHLDEVLGLAGARAALVS
ncbi:hypothetical protein BKE38_09335 [Pseudoroseomonas deserti]|uniref:Uncharacterized protein n=1 Tax=Teichococcus deserti TaxID=1817963 RepID=A0A1V2H3K0_9PROT|nr:hypothetical protein [Pseudoroseomonas deserti]ONG55254.1 hypothetical protein BKE38_09335 [Pseudoroseomonas deserti]